ncbi:dTDP-4-dehydrorhamnose 3,5-epimerase [Kaistia adipata]|uniref:dTDP-4-dehydrorhamnose 3,5-epimerase n=1 Tax=Kaistia adipata TaxID=166954 RepID=UPI0004057A65|nr:dTDP-4-dehydrorhamnose 3,5-epimerase [Kaistia adipata]
MTDIQRFAIDGLALLRPKVHGDDRGYFFEAFRQDVFEREVAPGVVFVQDNQSLSRQVGTVRGLHFQLAPRAQAKLVRVLRGAILDVAVDIRPDSPSFGQHIAVRLSAEDKNQLYVPAGFAHGFCTLEPDSEIHYKTSDFYSPEHDRGLAWDDPALGIEWGVSPADAILSERDRRHPRLTDLSL